MRFRDGWIGACIDEFEKAINEYKEKIKSISEDEYVRIIDPETLNNNTNSIQNITSHVVGAGIRMSSLHRIALGNEIKLQPNEVIDHGTIAENLDKLLSFVIETGVLMQKLPNEELKSKRIDAYWGQSYDPEQLFEHQVLHVQRHRRQLDKYHAGFYDKYK